MIRIAGFSGEIPRTTPRLLPENAAQEAFNTRLERGSLKPIRQPADITTLAAAAQTIYRHLGTWLGWDAIVDAVPGPVAQTRLYITGDGVPKVIVSGTTYDLALPGPTTALTSSIVSGVPDPATQQSVLWTYTFVTGFGEESEPAPLSASLVTDPTRDILLTGFEAGIAGRNITHQRIYRSQTSELGVTTLYLITQRAVGTGDFTDTAGIYPIQEPIPSTDFNPPPAGLTGLTALPNGMMAAFVGRDLYFCEPYQPHAWPEKYILTTDYDIVGLGAFGSNIAVMTEGVPYVVQGTAPDTMTMERLETNLPCVCASGIVDMGYFVAYPSTEGLVTIGSGGAQLVTRNLMTREQWNELDPASFRSGLFEGRYMASYESGSTRKIIAIDLSGDQSFIIRSDIVAQALAYEVGSGSLFILQNDRDVKEWDALGEPVATQVWKSKLFNLAGHTNFGALLIEGVAGVGETVSVEVYADGVLKATVTTLNEPMRLPSGFLALQWELKVTATAEITAISMASCPSELAQGGG